MYLRKWRVKIMSNGVNQSGQTLMRLDRSEPSRPRGLINCRVIGHPSPPANSPKVEKQEQTGCLFNVTSFSNLPAIYHTKFTTKIQFWLNRLNAAKARALQRSGPRQTKLFHLRSGFLYARKAYVILNNCSIFFTRTYPPELGISG